MLSSQVNEPPSAISPLTPEQISNGIQQPMFETPSNSFSFIILFGFWLAKDLFFAL